MNSFQQEEVNSPTIDQIEAIIEKVSRFLSIMNEEDAKKLSIALLCHMYFVTEHRLLNSGSKLFEVQQEVEFGVNNLIKDIEC